MGGLFCWSSGASRTRCLRAIDNVLRIFLCSFLSEADSLRNDAEEVKLNEHLLLTLTKIILAEINSPLYLLLLNILNCLIQLFTALYYNHNFLSIQ